MQSIFRYPGGKTKKHVRELILSYAPSTYLAYREPFVGGGGIFFGIDPLIPRWINDANDKLIAVYTALRDRPDEFIEKCQSIRVARKNGKTTYPKERSSGKKYDAKLKEEFDKLSYCEDCDQALRYFFINRTVWGGRVVFDKKLESRMYFSNPAGWNIIKTNRLKLAAEIMQGTRITSKDFTEIISAEGEDVWIYCDPPYWKDTHSALQSRLYENTFTKEDHTRLSDVIRQSAHKICLSYDDTPEIRSLYQDKKFTVTEASWTYCGTSSALSDYKEKKGKQRGKELIITNYKVPIKTIKENTPLFVD